MTLHERGGLEICPVCYWEDDNPEEQFGEPAPERPEGPNSIHLWQARKNFLAFGASEELLRSIVRPPHDNEKPPPKGLPLAIDDSVSRVDSGLPAFLTRSPEDPVYFGFPVLDDVEVDGFRLGVISDFEAEESTWGDAFVVAPDGSRGGLIWVVQGDDHWQPGGFDQVSPPEAGRWGVWQVAFPHPMRTRDEARRNLEAVLPRLREIWLEWRERFPEE